MKTVFCVVGIICIVIAALATPVSVVLGVYEWVGNDVEFKFALWYGIKVWIGMLLCIIPGIICSPIGKSF